MPLALGAFRLWQVLELCWLAPLGPQAQAAAALGASLRWFALSISVGLATAGMGLIAECIAQHDQHGANAVAWLVGALALVLNVLLGLLGPVLAPKVLNLLPLPADLFPLALAYLHTAFASLAPMGVLLALGAVWQAVGNSPLMTLVQVPAWGLSIAALQPLVYGWAGRPGLGIGGAALAAGLGTALMATVQVMLLGRGLGGGVRLERSSLALIPRYLWPLLTRAGRPVLQLASCALAQVILMSVIAGSGVTVLAGFAAARSLLLLLLIPSLAMGNLAALAGVWAVKAGRPVWGARRVWAAGAANLAYLGLMATAVFALAPRWLAALGASMSMQQYGSDALRLLAMGYLSSSLSVVLARGLDPTGQAVPSAWTNALSLWGVQLPLALQLGRMLGITGLWLGVAAGGVANGLLLSYRFRRGKWRIET
ncbi:MAG: MATE family efflux transporter [Anaerolineae bacterium]